jgi:hypothetical protein
VAIFTPSRCPVAEGFTFTNSRRRCFQRDRFSHGIYSRLLWDDVSIPFFLMKKKEKGGEEKTQELWGEVQFSAANGVKGYFLPCTKGVLCLSVLQ